MEFVVAEELGFTGTEYRVFWPCVPRMNPVPDILDVCVPPVRFGHGRLNESYDEHHSFTHSKDEGATITKGSVCVVRLVVGA